MTIDGTVLIEVPDIISAPDAAALTALEAGLERVRASTIRRGDSQITFSVGWFRFVPNWNLLVGIRSGSVSVVRSDQSLKLTFSLKSVDLFVLAAFAILSFVSSFPHGSYIKATLLWVSIYAIGYVMKWLRFSRFLRSCIVDAFDEWAAMAKTA